VSLAGLCVHLPCECGGVHIGVLLN
jgi:hypothetical protein